VKRRPQPKPERKQPTPQELLDSLLAFIETHFYSGHPLAFTKDKPRLLQWVVLKLATWLDERGVTLSTDRYREIMVNKILMEALRHGNTSKIDYLPAWLGKTVESHLAIHGEDYYDEAKSIRNLVDHAVMVAGQARVTQPDPVRELAAAARLLKSTRKAQKPVRKQAINPQLSLL